MADHTAGYFESHSQDYSIRRFSHIIQWVSDRVGPDDALFDIGCGTGQTLQAMSDAGVGRLAGCDVAIAALERARARVDFEPFQGSILDDDFVADHSGRYRFVTMSAVVHHLVGRTRRGSRRLAEQAIVNAFELLQPGGELVLIEACYSPSWAAGALFWAKRATSLVFRNRLELGRGNNLGPPVVSFYTPEALDRILQSSGARLVESVDEPHAIKRLPRLLGLRASWDSSRLVART